MHGYRINGCDFTPQFAWTETSCLVLYFYKVFIDSKTGIVFPPVSKHRFKFFFRWMTCTFSRHPRPMLRRERLGSPYWACQLAGEHGIPSGVHAAPPLAALTGSSESSQTEVPPSYQSMETALRTAAGSESNRDIPLYVK